MAFRTQQTDVLVIGSGAAGLYAALCAARTGRSVTLLTKSRLNRSSSAWAQGGIAAAMAPGDSPELHLEDTLRAGRGLCNVTAAEILTREAPACIRDLEALGVVFDGDHGRLHFGQEGGHCRRRIVHAGGSATGDSLVRALIDRTLKCERITVYDYTRVDRLLSDGVRCAGALASEPETAEPLVWFSPVTILATGGAAGLYSRTTNPPTAGGEGMALAYVAGAELMDMEFVQFHPTALRLKNARAILISEAVRGEGARLVNRAGVRFMPNYHELAELAPRDVVTAAIHQEMHAAGTDHVLLTLDALSPEFIVSRFPNIHQACLAEGLDITREPIPVAPAAHYSIGGVRTDLDGQTTLQGLWACGEVAATGVHGANRLASNSLLECLVFARRAVDRTTEMGVPPVPRGADKDVVPLARDEAGPPPLELAGLGQLMTDDVGVVRHADGLRRARDTMEAWAPAGAPPSISSRLIVARLMAEAALLRTETRGAHVRADYPHDEERWRRHIVFRKGAEPRCLGA